MPTDDLSAIAGLEDKHLRALARQQVTDLRSFAGADHREIYKAMANICPRPSLDRISRWQAEARDRLDRAGTGASEWSTVASFAVIFGQRQAGDAVERRIEAERTEVEPEQNPRTWAGWDFEPVGRWMAGQLGALAEAGTPAQPGAARPGAAPPQAGAAPPQPGAAPPAGAGTPGRSQLHIDSATITDASRTVGVVTKGALAAGLPAELTAPVRVALTVSGAQPGTVLHAVTRIVRPDGPGWNPQAPAVLPHSRRAEFDLSGVPDGHYEVSLIAWAPDATASPVSFRLPALTIRSGPTLKSGD